MRADGLRALGMRRLAAAIGYAPNSIYNAVGDLDQVVLRVNAGTFRRLRAALARATRPEAAPRENALALADAYLAFVAADPALWSLVSDYATAPGAAFPDWYADALAEPLAAVDAVLAPLLPEPAERRQAVAALWAALHGLAALSTSRKLAMLTPEPPEALARMLVGRFLG
ncbi:TetR-like C-terminal domain-containing protein [Methylobacterium nigriterrae]|uniref:TetR-like C-terminal domain-containing protein n=1 Tax=Methylobacterium nigriterrae TaxID=3127512 RepID=UPI0030139A75